MSTTTENAENLSVEPAKDQKQLTASNTRPSSGARLPSLTQLAARISPSAPIASASSRPRLATSVLRSNSAASSFTNVSATSGDSTAVIPPTTRPVSPEGSDRSTGSLALNPSNSTTASEAGSVAPPEIPAPIVDKEEKIIRGYKNIPSLNAITERMRKTKLNETQQAAATGLPIVSIAPPEEDTPVPGTANSDGAAKKETEHPLQHTWTLYHDSKSKTPYTPFNNANAEAPQHVPPASTESGAYEAGLTVVGEFKTVEGFCRYFNWLKPPSKLDRSSNYHLFKDGIKPMWEDPENANGGKWVLTIKNNPQLLDRCWSWLAMALVGEELDEKDEVCGAVVSLRAKIDRIQLWTRGKEDVEAINSLGKKFIKLLDVAEEQGVGLEFQYNTEDKPMPNKFLAIQSSYSQTGYNSYRGTPTTATTPTFPNGVTSSTAPPPVAAPTPVPVPVAPVAPPPTQAAAPAPAESGGSFGAWRPKRALQPNQE